LIQVNLVIDPTTPELDAGNIQLRKQSHPHAQVFGRLLLG
jgi:hypothetical protein